MYPIDDLALLCQTCDSEIDLVDDTADLAVCRHCGLAFLLDDQSSAFNDRTA